MTTISAAKPRRPVSERISSCFLYVCIASPNSDLRDFAALANGQCRNHVGAVGIEAGGPKVLWAEFRVVLPTSKYWIRSHSRIRRGGKMGLFLASGRGCASEG